MKGWRGYGTGRCGGGRNRSMRWLMQWQPNGVVRRPIQSMQRPNQSDRQRGVADPVRGSAAVAVVAGTGGLGGKK